MDPKIRGRETRKKVKKVFNDQKIRKHLQAAEADLKKIQNTNKEQVANRKWSINSGDVATQELE